MNENTPVQSVPPPLVVERNASPTTKVNETATSPRKVSNNAAVPDSTSKERLEGIAYSSFHSVTKDPIRISKEAFELCRPRSDAFTAERKARGPHFAPAVKLFANDIALKQLRTEETYAMPVGATIVKEKWWNEAEKSPYAYAAMIKREPGYDPKHGNWEYVYVPISEEKPVERGLLKSCIDCHATAEKRDFLFRKYLISRAEKTPAKK